MERVPLETKKVKFYVCMAKVAEVACQKGVEGVDFELNSANVWSNTYEFHCGFVDFMSFFEKSCYKTPLSRL